MRFVIELTRAGDAVAGWVSCDGRQRGFSGWLELLSLLEAPDLATETLEDKTRARAPQT